MFVQSPRNDYGPLKDCPSGKWEAFLLEAGVLRLNLGSGPAPAFFCRVQIRVSALVDTSCIPYRYISSATSLQVRAFRPVAW